MLGRLVVAAALTALLLAPLASANTTAPDWVETEYRVEFTSLTGLYFNATVKIHKVTLDGDAYPADDFRSAYQQAARYNQALGDQFVAKLENRVRSDFEAGLAKAFPSAPTREVLEVRLDRATLEGSSDGDPYNPTVNLLLASRVEQDRAALGLAEISDEAVQAAFDAGARVNFDLTLSADPGYKNTYRITPPPGLGFTQVAPGSADSGVGLATVDNTRGATALDQAVTLTLADPEATPATAEDVDTTIAIAIASLDLAPEGLPLDVSLDVEVHALDLAEVAPDALPENVELRFLTAEGMRRLHEVGLIDDAALAAAEQSLLQRLNERLAASLGNGTTVTGSFDEATLAPDAPEDAPLAFVAHASAYRDVPGTEGMDSVQPAFDAGAAVSIPVTLMADPERELTFTVEVPEGVRIVEATGDAVIDPSGRYASYTVPAGAEARQESLTLAADDVRVYDKEEASLSVTIDLYDIDVSVAKAAGGDFGALLVNVEMRGELAVLKIPEDLKQRLPENVQLDYLSAAGVRALYAGGYISKEDFDKLNEQLLTQARERIGAALGETVVMTGGFDEATLAADTPEDSPIVFTAKTSIRKPLAGGGSKEPQTQAALALYEVPQTFNLPRIEGRETSYTFILPKGLAVTALTASDAETGRSEIDGRDAFTVTPQGDSSKVDVMMAVTPAFVVAKFWPVLLGAALVLALLVGGPIVGVAVARRRKRAKQE